VDIYASTAGAFMGTARLAQMAADEASDAVRHEGMASRERQIEEKRRALKARIAAMEAEFDAEAKDSEIMIAEEKARDKILSAGKEALSEHRGAKIGAGKRGGKK